MHETSICVRGNMYGSPLAVYVDAALKKAQALDTRLPDHILSMDGMSGRKYRRFINNLIGSTPDVRYLEVGSWAGSTACAAVSGNSLTATCIDNWSQFGGPKDAFLANIKKAVSPNTVFKFIESDFRKVDWSGIGKYNIYLFDGPHEYQDQYDGLSLALPALDNEFVFIVDDWNFGKVIAGTNDAIKALGLTIVYSVEIRTTHDGSHPKIAHQNSAWHNGYFISVLSSQRMTR